MPDASQVTGSALKTTPMDHTQTNKGERQNWQVAVKKVMLVGTIIVVQLTV